MTWAPDYASVADLAAWLRIEDDADDAQLALYVTAASRAVDAFCKRQFGLVAAAEERVYEGIHDRRCGTWEYMIDDLMTVTGSDLDGDPLAVADLRERNAVAKGRPWTRLVSGSSGPLTVSARWGWTAVPSPVKTATLLQAARLSARRDAPLGISGSPSEGGETRLLAVLDPDLKTSLKGYRREVWVL